MALLLTALLGACAEAVDDRDRVVGQLRLGAVLGEAELDGYAYADTVQPIELSRDLGAHPAFRSEWWYLTVMLADAAGREFGVQFTVFRQALWPGAEPANAWRTGQAYLAHLAVTDDAGGRHRELERLARGHPQLAGVSTEPFAVWVEDWRLAAAADGGFELSARGPDLAVALTLAPVKPVVLQGDRGLSRKGPGQASYYYSFTRIDAAGAITMAGHRNVVQGSAWLDREWSTSVLSAGQVGWDWFALQLDDGSDIMAFQLRRRDGTRDPHDHGVLVDPAGAATVLKPAEFTLEPLERWRDDDGVAWPVAWRVDLPGRSLRVVAALPDQRMDTTIVYWEGLVHVYDAAGGRIGRGYMELTGYADE